MDCHLTDLNLEESPSWSFRQCYREIQKYTASHLQTKEQYSTCRHITHTDPLPAPDTMELQPALSSTVPTANNESLAIFLHVFVLFLDHSETATRVIKHTGLHRKQKFVNHFTQDSMAQLLSN